MGCGKKAACQKIGLSPIVTHVQHILHYTPKALVFPGQICIEDGELEGMVVSDT